jgi:microcystin-dependent protein
MADQFIGEIRVFPFNFAPQGWAFCSGQIMSISQNTALFSLLGTTYGGNGTSNFALPNLNGNVAVSSGESPGLSLYDLGQTGGATTVALNSGQLAQHSHELQASSANATSHTPVGMVPATSVHSIYGSNDSAVANAGEIGFTGGTQPHNNLQPYLVLNYSIALVGIFPARS